MHTLIIPPHMTMNKHMNGYVEQTIRHETNQKGVIDGECTICQSLFHCIQDSCSNHEVVTGY
jgi:hypothetical protein